MPCRVMRASLMRTMSRTPCSSSLRGSGMLPTSGMPGYPFGPQPRSTSTESAVTSRSGSSMRARMSSIESNTTAGPTCCSSSGVAAAGLTIAPRGREVAAQHRDAGVGHQRRVARPDHGVVEDRLVGEVVDEAACRSR